MKRKLGVTIMLLSLLLLNGCETERQIEVSADMSQSLHDDRKVTYLTFDDGPCESTPQLLAELRKLKIKATFFVTAQFGTDKQVVEWLKQIHAEGHTIGVHSYSHRYNEIYQSVDRFLEDYRKMDDLIVQATGEHSQVYRFPGGSNTTYNASVREDVILKLSSQGSMYYDWNAYNGDCDGFTQSEMITKAVTESGYRNKSILLMHNIPKKEIVLRTLSKIVGQLRQKGYQFDVLDGRMTPIQFIKSAEVIRKVEEKKENQAVAVESKRGNTKW